jgi:hypothetical protein
MQAWPQGVLGCKFEEVIMDKPHARKLARVVLIEGEDKNPIGI